MKERGREMLFIRVLAAILVLALAAAMQSSIAEPANSPGHDSLYVLRGGDNASGTYNFSGMLFVNGTSVGIGTVSPEVTLHLSKATAGNNIYITIDNVSDTIGVPALWLARNYSGDTKWGGMG